MGALSVAASSLHLDKANTSIDVKKQKTFYSIPVPFDSVLVNKQAEMSLLYRKEVQSRQQVMVRANMLIFKMHAHPKPLKIKVKVFL